jgi:hypothetical protein
MVGQHFLRKHAGRHRADMAAGLHSLDHQRIDTGTDQFLGQCQCRGETDQFRAIALDPIDRAGRGQAAREHDMADTVVAADVDQFAQIGMHRDQIHAERLFGERFGRGDFRIQQGRGHRTTCDHAEAAGIGHCGDEVAFAHPRHGAGHDRVARAEKFCAARHQAVGARVKAVVSHRSALTRSAALGNVWVRRLPTPPNRSGSDGPPPGWRAGHRASRCYRARSCQPAGR